MATNSSVYSMKRSVEASSPPPLAGARLGLSDTLELHLCRTIRSLHSLAWVSTTLANRFQTDEAGIRPPSFSAVDMINLGSLTEEKAALEDEVRAVLRDMKALERVGREAGLVKKEVKA